VNKFDPGRGVVTPGAFAAFEAPGELLLITSRCTGLESKAEVDGEEAQRNELSFKRG
jgi:hypothetical protein